MQTYALIELIGENRILGTMVDELPEGTSLSRGDNFILDGKVYRVDDRFDDIRFNTSEDECKGAVKLWRLIRLLAGSDAGAIAIADAIEPIGSADYKLTVKVDDAGAPISVSINRTGCLSCVTFVQARRAMDLPSLRGLANHLRGLSNKGLDSEQPD